MQAFVAMPFNSNFLPVWKVIKKACEANVIKPCRVDQLPQVDDIHKTIFSEIEKSDIIIVDFTGDKVLSVPNPNVVTEATHAKGKCKPIVILTQSLESLPFDWRTYRAIVYQNNESGLQYLIEILTENLTGILERLASHEPTTDLLNKAKSSQKQEQWTAKLLAKNKHEITIKVKLNKETYKIEYKTTYEAWSELTVKIDGEVVAIQKCSLAGEFITGQQKIEFIITDEDESYQGVIVAQHSIWSGKIKRLSMTIGSLTLYDETY